ncbi:MAG: DNA pilot protein [Arizlama microvirus]|nr:MAG: DNA pilot protein [Arizlama microvirus]
MFGGLMDVIVPIASVAAAPFTGGASLAAGAAYMGASMTNKTNASIAANRQAFDAEQAQKQMDFQQQNSNTSYQRAVNDMKLAGLNPMLAYSQGGASTPTGAAAQSSGYEARNVLGETATAALGAYKNIQEVAQMQQQTKQIEAQTEATKEQTLNTSADTANKIAHNPNIPIEGKKLVSQITLNNELSKTQTTAQGLNRATTKNVQENIAPSGDPYWYRDAKGLFFSAKDAWLQKIKPQLGK